MAEITTLHKPDSYTAKYNLPLGYKNRNSIFAEYQLKYFAWGPSNSPPEVPYVKSEMTSIYYTVGKELKWTRYHTQVKGRLGDPDLFLF